MLLYRQIKSKGQAKGQKGQKKNEISDYLHQNRSRHCVARHTRRSESAGPADEQPRLHCKRLGAHRKRRARD
nr:MAG TPA: hypothetical protein [Caudoviricetes sp.]